MDAITCTGYLSSYNRMGKSRNREIKMSELEKFLNEARKKWKDDYFTSKDFEKLHRIVGVLLDGLDNVQGELEDTDKSTGSVIMDAHDHAAAARAEADKIAGGE